MIERRDDPLETDTFRLFQTEVHVLKRRAECLAHDLGRIELVEGVDPRRRQRCAVERLGVAFGVLARIDAVGDAVADARQDRSDDQERVGVGSRDAVLDARRAIASLQRLRGREDSKGGSLHPWVSVAMIPSQ